MFHSHLKEGSKDLWAHSLLLLLACYRLRLLLLTHRHLLRRFLFSLCRQRLSAVLLRLYLTCLYIFFLWICRRRCLLQNIFLLWFQRSRRRLLLLLLLPGVARPRLLLLLLPRAARPLRPQLLARRLVLESRRLAARNKEWVTMPDF